MPWHLYQQQKWELFWGTHCMVFDPPTTTVWDLVWGIWNNGWTCLEETFYVYLDGKTRVCKVQKSRPHLSYTNFTFLTIMCALFKVCTWKPASLKCQIYLKSLHNCNLNWLPVLCHVDFSKDVWRQPHFWRVVGNHAQNGWQGNVLDGRELFGGELARVGVEKPVGIPQNLQDIAVFLNVSLTSLFHY